jgi:exportin-7
LVFGFCFVFVLFLFFQSECCAILLLVFVIMDAEPAMNGASGPGSIPVSIPAGLSSQPNTPSKPLNPQMAERLGKIESLCEAMYMYGDQSAKQQLVAFESSPQCIPQCQLILDHSQNQYALTMASSSLLSLTTTHWNRFSPAQALDIRNYLVRYLGLNCKTMRRPVRMNIISIIARITKLGWFVEPKLHAVNEVAMQFVSLSLAHCVVGFEILNEVVSAMNQSSKKESLVTHRKTAAAFRDSQLLTIFKLALTNLKQLGSNQIQNNDPALISSLKRAVLMLCIRCLGFDFLGTSADESGEDAGTIQIPSSWRQIFIDSTVVPMFFGVFETSTPPHAALALEALVFMSSCRRSLFPMVAQRTAFVESLCKGTFQILANHQQKLQQDADSYHHFCRLLSRIKANYQLQELVSLPNYQQWITTVANFTIDAFKNLEETSNSVHYLLYLWSRLTLATSYMKADSKSFLEEFIPRVTQSVIDTRLNAFPQAVRDDTVEDLFQEPDFSDLLKRLPSLCRYRYAQASNMLMARLNPLARTYKECITALSQNQVVPEMLFTLRVTEGQLAFLIEVLGAVLGGYVGLTGLSSRNEQADIDSGFCAFFFQLIPVVAHRFRMRHADAPLSLQLDLAMVNFLQNFRRAYITLQATPKRSNLSRTNSSSRGLSSMGEESEAKDIYSRIAKKIGPTTQDNVISMMLKKIVANLKFWPRNPIMIRACLQLLDNLSCGYASGKAMAQLDTAKALLKNHSAQFFPFLDMRENESFRVMFYTTMSRLLFMDANCGMFDVFVATFENVMQRIDAQNNPRIPEVRQAAAGLAWDLVGVVEGIRSSKAYKMFFDWMYPKGIGLILRMLETWWDAADVSVPILQLLAALVNNKATRIRFHVSSPNGVLLFREASKALVIYGNRIMDVKTSIDDLYEQRIKGIGSCMTILTNALSGGFVNFGIFTLYKDRCLTDAVTVVLKLVRSVPLSELLAYVDIAESYFVFVEVLLRTVCEIAIAFDTRIFLPLINSLQQGLQSLHANMVAKAASAIDHLFSFRQKLALSKRYESAETLRKLNHHMSNSGTMVFDMFRTLMDMVLFERVSHYWSLSRPVLSILCAQKQCLKKYQDYLMQAQQPDSRPKLAEAFVRLMQDVQPNLTLSNNDKFTSNMAAFRKTVSSFIVRPTIM